MEGKQWVKPSHHTRADSDQMAAVLRQNSMAYMNNPPTARVTVGRGVAQRSHPRQRKYNRGWWAGNKTLPAQCLEDTATTTNNKMEAKPTLRIESEIMQINERHSAACTRAAHAMRATYSYSNCASQHERVG